MSRQGPRKKKSTGDTHTTENIQLGVEATEAKTTATKESKSRLDPPRSAVHSTSPSLPSQSALDLDEWVVLPDPTAAAGTASRSESHTAESIFVAASSTGASSAVAVEWDSRSNATQRRAHALEIGISGDPPVPLYSVVPTPSPTFGNLAGERILGAPHGMTFQQGIAQILRDINTSNTKAKSTTLEEKTSLTCSVISHLVSLNELFSSDKQGHFKKIFFKQWLEGPVSYPQFQVDNLQGMLIDMYKICHTRVDLATQFHHIVLDFATKKSSIDNKPIILVPELIELLVIDLLSTALHSGSGWHAATEEVIFDIVAMVQDSTANIRVLNKIALANRLLSCYQKDFVRLLQQRSIAMERILRIVVHLADLNADTLQSYLYLMGKPGTPLTLVEGLRDLAHSSKPLSYLHFHERGAHSLKTPHHGLINKTSTSELPTLSIALWFCVDVFCESSYIPLITAGGISVGISLSSIAIDLNGYRWIFDVHIPPGQWSHLVVSCTPSDAQACHTFLWFNGLQVETQNEIPCPSEMGLGPQSPTFQCIADNILSHNPNTSWYLGPVYCFSEPLRAENVVFLYSQGPNFTYVTFPQTVSALQLRTVVQMSHSAHIPIQLNQSAFLSRNLLFLFRPDHPALLYPPGTQKSSEIHVNPKCGSASRKSGNFFHTLERVGGLSVLLYLLVMAEDKTAARIYLDLILEFTENNEEQLYKLKQYSAYKIISAVLLKFSSEVDSESLVQSALNFAFTSSPPIIWNKKALYTIVLNAQLWQRFNKSIQQLVYNTFCQALLHGVVDTSDWSVVTHFLCTVILSEGIDFTIKVEIISCLAKLNQVHTIAVQVLQPMTLTEAPLRHDNIPPNYSPMWKGLPDSFFNLSGTLLKTLNSQLEEDPSMISSYAKAIPLQFVMQCTKQIRGYHDTVFRLIAFYIYVRPLQEEFVQTGGYTLLKEVMTCNWNNHFPTLDCVRVLLCILLDELPSSAMLATEKKIPELFANPIHNVAALPALVVAVKHVSLPTQDARDLLICLDDAIKRNIRHQDMLPTILEHMSLIDVTTTKNGTALCSVEKVVELLLTSCASSPNLPKQVDEIIKKIDQIQLQQPVKHALHISFQRGLLNSLLQQPHIHTADVQQVLISFIRTIQEISVTSQVLDATILTEIVRYCFQHWSSSQQPSLLEVAQKAVQLGLQHPNEFSTELEKIHELDKTFVEKCYSRAEKKLTSRPLNSVAPEKKETSWSDSVPSPIQLQSAAPASFPVDLSQSKLVTSLATIFKEVTSEGGVFSFCVHTPFVDIKVGSSQGPCFKRVFVHKSSPHHPPTTTCFTLRPPFISNIDSFSPLHNIAALPHLSETNTVLMKSLPRIHKIDPPSQQGLNGKTIQIEGVNFQVTTRFFIGGIEAPVEEFRDATSVTVKTPQQTELGNYEVIGVENGLVHPSGIGHFSYQDDTTFDSYMKSKGCFSETAEMAQLILPDKQYKTCGDARGHHCTKINAYDTLEGTFYIRDSSICFQKQQTPSHGDQLKPSCISIAYGTISKVLKMRYNLQNCALEIHSSSHCKPLMISFDSEEIQKEVYDHIIGKAPNSAPPPLSQLTLKWQNGEMTNFEYLMFVNYLAGRTYEDWHQYPVFPYILADYVSSVMDFENPKTFRDLTKPMGAQSEYRLQHVFRKRYDDLARESMAPYMYSQHYSTFASVIHYMTRLQPFASYHLDFQSGTFDQPARLFTSIEHSWHNSSSSTQGDVKELIPEFFYLHNFLVNTNWFNFGVRPDNTRVHNIELPVWANGDRRKFIRLHQKALECKYVSEHIHKWVDLIFGVAQQSFSDDNVFRPTSVEGGSVPDPTFAEAQKIETLLCGQVPKKIFHKPHPCRDMEIVNQAYQNVFFVHPETLFGTVLSVSKDCGTHSIASVGNGKYSTRSAGENEAFLNPDAKKIISWSKNHPGVLFVKTWNQNTEYSFEIPNEKIYCGVCSSDGRYFGCGGYEGVLYLWKKPLSFTSLSECPPSLFSRPHMHLRGHFSPLKTIAICGEYNTAVTADRTGRCILWHLSSSVPRQICTLAHTGTILHLCINEENGGIFSTCKVGQSFCITQWDVNGKRIGAVTLNDAITCILTTSCPDGVCDNVVVTGHISGKVCMWSTTTLEKCWVIEPEGPVSPVTAICTSKDHKNLFTINAFGITRVLHHCTEGPGLL
ncbi:beige/BEACH domain-containing protein [Pelomyxa schiedti]|nr:beige/BEACH domain-containing protein [Pelomyxa schiedti]